MEITKAMMVLSLLLFLLLPLAAISDARGAIVGGWQPLKDPSDPQVVEIGNYAVSEYDKRSKADLRFDHVVKGQTQVVAGINYKLIIAAKEGEAGPTKNYEAIVWEKAWQHFMNLTSFKPAAAPGKYS